MSFKPLFFGWTPFFLKLGIILFLGFGLQSIQAQQSIQNPSCFRDIKNYSPYLLTGQLTWKHQKRFFNCIWGLLDLVVVKKVIIHDASRDYFTREEVFRFFHLYLEYDKAQSHKITNSILTTKKLLVGGSIDKLRDQELEWIFRLIYDYRDAYYIINKQLPNLMKVFSSQESLHPEQRQRLLEQFKKSFERLHTAYKRENVIYRIQSSDISESKAPARFLQSLLEGLLFPKKEIQNWDLAFKTLYKSLNLALYYKTYFKESLPDIEKRYIQLETLNLFLDMIAENKQKGFPLNQMDQMLLSTFEVLENSSSFLSKFKDKDRLALMTRSMLCLSLKHPKGCKINSENQALHISFPDSKFILSDNQLVKQSLTQKEILFLTYEQIQALQKRIKDYQLSLQDIYSGFIEETALKHQFDQWLDTFFRWNKDRMYFGNFHSTTAVKKSVWLLHYKTLLSLFLDSYLPEGFFTDTKESIPIDTWQKIVSDFSPLMSIVFPAHNMEMKENFNQLFLIADQFLNSSDRDQKLNSKELMDLSIHLLSAFKQSQTAFEWISKHCDTNNIRDCSVQSLFENEKLLSPYPRFKDYIFTETKQKYFEKISLALEGIDGDNLSSMDFLPLFLLIQIMETNYYLLDKNKSFNLESSELLSLAHSLKEEVYINIPDVYSEEQALSYIMYSFKTGVIPFFTGSGLESLKFTHWHLHPESRKPFTITANEFHFLIFDLYNLYKKF